MSLFCALFFVCYWLATCTLQVHSLSASVGLIHSRTFSMHCFNLTKLASKLVSQSQCFLLYCPYSLFVCCQLFWFLVLYMKRIIPEEFVRSTQGAFEHRVVFSVRWGNSWQLWLLNTTKLCNNTFWCNYVIIHTKHNQSKNQDRCVRVKTHNILEMNDVGPVGL